MNIISCFSKIESLEFVIETNLANSIDQFKSIVSEMPELDFIRKNVPPLQIFQRISEIRSVAKARAEYQHPMDAAIAAYLWVLANDNISGLRGILSSFSNSVDFWWAKKLSRDILAKYITQTASKIVEAEAYSQKVRRVPNLKNVCSQNRRIFENSNTQNYKKVA